MCLADDLKPTAGAPPTDTATGQCAERSKHYSTGSKNDPADLAGLVTQYAGFVYWLSKYVIGNSKGAENVLQKTFLAVQSGFPDLKQKESVVTRLARIAVNESFAQLGNRNTSKLPWLGLDAEVVEVFVPQEIVDWGDDVEKRYGGEQLRKIVREGVQSLTPFSRVVLLLRDVGHLKPEEIADLLGLPVPRVKAQLLGSRLRLREHLNKYFRSDLKEKAQTA